MWAMIVKEFRQVVRDRRTLAMMIVLPVLLLVVLGYAASFDVKTITVAVAGPQAATAGQLLKAPFKIVETETGQGRTWAADQLRDGKADVAVVTGATRPLVLIDGSQLFAAKAALAALGPVSVSHHLGFPGSATSATQVTPKVIIMYNPGLKT